MSDLFWNLSRHLFEKKWTSSRTVENLSRAQANSGIVVKVRGAEWKWPCLCSDGGPRAPPEWPSNPCRTRQKPRDSRQVTKWPIHKKNKSPILAIYIAVICLQRVSFNILTFKTSLTGTSGPERYQRSQPAERSPHRRVCSRQWDASCDRRQRRHDRHCRTLDRHREPVKCKPGCHAAIWKFLKWTLWPLGVENI